MGAEPICHNSLLLSLSSKAFFFAPFWGFHKVLLNSWTKMLRTRSSVLALGLSASLAMSSPFCSTGNTIRTTGSESKARENPSLHLSKSESVEVFTKTRPRNCSKMANCKRSRSSVTPVTNKQLALGPLFAVGQYHRVQRAGLKTHHLVFM